MILMAIFDTQQEKVLNIPLEHIKADPQQPRKRFDERSLKELADSIKEFGLLQPIMVRRNDGDETYVIVHGERRFRAHQIAALPTIKCIVTDRDTELNSIRIVENVLREDLSDLDLAREFQKRVDAGETHQQIANKIHKSRAFVTQRLALLRLPEERQEQLEHRKITFASARMLVASDNENKPIPEPKYPEEHGVFLQPIMVTEPLWKRLTEYWTQTTGTGKPMLLPEVVISLLDEALTQHGYGVTMDKEHPT